MNILFLTVSTGGGHVKAAQALMQQMEKQIPGCKTRLVDSLKYINPTVDRLVTGAYLHTINKAPGIYGRLYDLSEKDETITNIVKGFNYILSHRLYSLFEQYRPDAAVCTHTMPLQMLSRLKKKGLLNIPLIGIVTDYTSHFFWKLAGVDVLIVAHPCIKNDMVNMGIRESSIHACGIPVSGRFLDTSGNRSLQLKNMGFEESKPTLLLMGGSLGFGGMRPVLSSLLSLRNDIQIIAVAGCNKQLEKQLKSITQNSAKNVRILGYTDSVSELMDVSSLLITKPGGITISEALVKKLPILLMTPIPGQEERNARFLSDSGAAVRLTSSDSLEVVLERTLGRPSVMQKMSEAAGRLAKPHACEDIAVIVEELIQKRTEDKLLLHGSQVYSDY